MGLTNLDGLCKGFKSQRVFCIDWFILAAIFFLFPISQSRVLLKCSVLFGEISKEGVLRLFGWKRFE